MISRKTEENINFEVVAFDLPESTTLHSVLVQVRRVGDKALIVEQPEYRSK